MCPLQGKGGWLRASLHFRCRQKKWVETVSGFLPTFYPLYAGNGLFTSNSGAGEMNRTPDLLITNELLYRLSYTGDKL